MNTMNSRSFRTFKSPELRDKFVHETVLKTYLTLLGISGLCCFGVILNNFLHFPSGLATFISFCLIIAFSIQKWMKSTIKTKLFTILAFGLFQGFSLSYLVSRIYYLNSGIVYTALFATFIMFLCFSGAAYFGKTNFLYLGAILSTCMSLLGFLGFMNIFFGFKFVFLLQLYGGLLLFCFYLCYDTQKMLLKIKNGDDDFVNHSVELFLDLLAIFIRLLIILAKKDSDKEEKKKKKKRR